MSTSELSFGGRDGSRVRTELHADYICDYLSEGPTEGLAGACRDLSVSRMEIYRWIADDAEFAKRMDEARRVGAHAIAERARTRMETDSIDPVTGRPHKDYIMRAYRMAELDMKLLKVWHPKEYGDKLQVESTNANINIPVGTDPNEAAQAYKQLVGG